MKVATKHS